jgi:hypothetical protein
VVPAEVSFGLQSPHWCSEGCPASRYRKFPWGISHMFLLINVAVRHSQPDLHVSPNGTNDPVNV